MTFERLSGKQRELLTWAFQRGEEYRGVICDGAVRSGKTVCMVTAFVLWAMRYFDGASFGITGKTVRSAERNIVMPLENVGDITAYFNLRYNRSLNRLTVQGGGKENYFYIFGGRDESSFMLIQGITLAGVLFDEVALMPRSFVEQAIARTLSVEGSKLWFNCNPESPAHWFREEWILKAEEKRVLHLHFLMSDNPILTKSAIEDGERLYSGVFYDRYIKGLWVVAEGLIYTGFHKDRHVVESVERDYEQFLVSCDYGTVNPTSMGLWGLFGGKWYRMREYYFDSRKEQRQKTDEEHYESLCALVGGLPIGKVIVDPSAASFMECIRRHRRFRVVAASNKVLDGIREVASHLQQGDLLFCDGCQDAIREFSLYRWDEKAGDDRPMKIDDHAMDDIRYFVRSAFGAGCVGF